MAVLGFGLTAMCMFMFMLMMFCVSESVSTDAMSLLAIKNQVSFDPLKVLEDWNVTKNHCDWYGVTCDGVSGRVVSLNINGSEGSDAKMEGTLSSAVGNLTELRKFSLPYNAFYGKIPVEIGRLDKLESMQIQGNRFSGQIPEQISNLSFLRVLNLSYNAFNGSIPEKLIGFARIRSIDLSYNQLNGEIKIDWFSRCESLVDLRLSGNFLVDSIPPEIGNCSRIRSLLLDGNILEYQIPAEIGRISELRVLDVSRNSLTGRIPKELVKCRKLSVLVLTNLGDSSVANARGEFNAFEGGIPSEVLLLPNLEIVWAPRANFFGRLPNSWSDSCKMRVLNLGQNYLAGSIPKTMGLCKNLTFLDLSSNKLRGSLPPQIRVPCMVHFNVSHNSLSGYLPRFGKSNCTTSMITYSHYSAFYDKKNVENGYSFVPIWDSKISRPFEQLPDGDFVVTHDFSWNQFIGSLPLFSFGDGFSPTSSKPSYSLLLNNNQLNGSLPGELFSACMNLHSFAVNVSVNQIAGVIPQGLFSNCSQLSLFEAAYNRLVGSIPNGVEGSEMLQCLDLRGNRLSGSIPDQVGKLKALKWILLSRNNFAGEIPTQLTHLPLLVVLDLSHNSLTGPIPASLANASKLETLLLDHNKFVGEIPLSFSTLASLTNLDVSFNNLSGHIPHLQHFSDCSIFKGNIFLQPCPNPVSPSKPHLPVPLDVRRRHGLKGKMKVIVITVVTSASVLVLVLLAIFSVVIFGRRRRMSRVASLRRKIVVTFTQVPAEMNYDNVVRATGHFNVGYLIGTGGFGATYKAELAPDFLVAVKRLSIGKFQGFQQFEAEIRTLGRIRHKNLVTLIGYYMGEAEMFLIYNYLSGGNLETFIHERSGESMQWPVIHKIALDIAQALAYLHYSCVPRIVHRDIKPSNILLDEEHNAYISDFGLARLLEVSESHATTDVAGTFGYVAPEYATTCRVSDKADVYSFGVVLLELMSGKRSLDPSFSEYGNGFTIVAWAELLNREGHSHAFFSPELWEAGPQENLLAMLKLAAACTVESLSVRPSMKHVADKLRQLKIPKS